MCQLTDCSWKLETNASPLRLDSATSGSEVCWHYRHYSWGKKIPDWQTTEEILGSLCEIKIPIEYKRPFECVNVTYLTLILAGRSSERKCWISAKSSCPSLSFCTICQSVLWPRTHCVAITKSTTGNMTELNIPAIFGYLRKLRWNNLFLYAIVTDVKPGQKVTLQNCMNWTHCNKVSQY